jgi:uncharacterized protein
MSPKYSRVLVPEQLRDFLISKAEEFLLDYYLKINTIFAKKRERMSKAKYWVDLLQLIPHPEGGFYKENYRSEEAFEDDENENFPSGRALATSIYFLMEAGDFSTFHRIKSDEVWHFYDGDPIEIFHFDFDGKLHCTVLGRNAEKGKMLTTVVPANLWFGSRPASGSSYSLVGCTVSPGFDFRDFEMAKKSELLREFPSHEAIIAELCR